MALRAASSGVAYRWTYDVFLSFRGEDTRSGFTGNLYNTLRKRGFCAFIDDEDLRRGEEITPALFKAIQQSKIAIVVLSKNYAFSTFCLDELVEILECFKEGSQELWPIFYDVDPSDVRNLRGNFGEALAQHQNRFKYDEEKVQKCRLALSKTANLSGWHIKCGVGYEYEFIGRIVDEVSRTINYTPLHVADCPVGLVSRVQKVTSLLDLSSEGKVIMIGIWGIGGIGKSTVSRAMYTSVADTFDSSCFLSNVREIDRIQAAPLDRAPLLGSYVLGGYAYVFG
ncbi:hypothetical protein QN277_012162 [Acacia crassicarpa]|uniref:TIR domain-containing protein n=1 Tax=Acacia crassicarpa TaxID=499986 RepID=A0AAE1TEB0_9FABA|nr:hypothetical protein QN277_012162 [Acacia crassicarpa]